MTRSFLIAALALVCAPAAAHDDAQWIADGNYKNAAGQLCCGPSDCRQVPAADVAPTVGGYWIKSLGELVLYHQAQPSPNGAYWRCFWGGERKCFFAPPPNS